jgi:hypothetical protein
MTGQRWKSWAWCALRGNLCEKGTSQPTGRARCSGVHGTGTKNPSGKTGRRWLARYTKQKRRRRLILGRKNELLRPLESWPRTDRESMPGGLERDWPTGNGKPGTRIFDCTEIGPRQKNESLGKENLWRRRLRCKRKGDNPVYIIVKWSNPKYVNAKRLFLEMPSYYNFLFQIYHPPLKNTKLLLPFLHSLTQWYKNDRFLCKYQILILFENFRKFSKHICIGKFSKIHILIFLKFPVYCSYF